jgi:hypothetical protein
MKVIGPREVQAILAVTDRAGLHREKVVIPLAARHPGRVRRRTDGKVEIVVDAAANFADWIAGLEGQLAALEE